MSYLRKHLRSKLRKKENRLPDRLRPQAGKAGARANGSLLPAALLLSFWLLSSVLLTRSFCARGSQKKTPTGDFLTRTRARAREASPHHQQEETPPVQKDS